MSQDYGIKVSKAGANAESTDPRDLLMDSKYNMLKVHQDSTSNITFTPGDTYQYADFTHNLGYVPAFMPYVQDLSDSSKLRFIGFTPPTDLGVAYWSYADSSKVRIGVSLIGVAYNRYQSDQSQGGGAAASTTLYDEHFGDHSHIVVGKKDGNTRNGAIIIGPVNVSQGVSINDALLGYAVNFKGAGSGDLKGKIYGIAEDNTSTSGNPMGRSKTSNSDTANWSLPSVGQHSQHGITSIVQEIVNRGGWSYGNNMGFLVYDNGSPSEVWAEDDTGTGIDSKLDIKYGGNTTITVRAIIFKDKIV